MDTSSKSSGMKEYSIFGDQPATDSIIMGDLKAFPKMKNQNVNTSSSLAPSYSKNYDGAQTGSP